MRALFETLSLDLSLDPAQDLLLLYRVRTPAEAVFAGELDRIAAHRPRARVHYLTGDVGPLSAELFTRLVPDLVDRDVYLCGPPGLAGAVRQSLRDAGLPDGRLHEERFDF